jgi:hypothetical protein
MALNIQPFQFQFRGLQAPQTISQPTWGPPDMSKQLQEGIANILPQLAKAYQGVNNQMQNEAAGKEWMKAADQTQQPPATQPLVNPPSRYTGEGPGAPLKGELNQLADAKNQQYGLPAGYLNQLASTESTGDPNAVSPTGAKGLTQFTGGTWKTYGLGKNPFDPEANLDAAGRFTLANRAELRAGLGREPTAGELYLAHQQGAGGALALLANPDRPAVEVTKPQNIMVNGGTMGMTAGDFAKKWTSRFDGQGPVAAGTGVAPGAMAATGRPEGPPIAMAGAPGAPPTATAHPDAPIPPQTAPVAAGGPQTVAQAAPGVVPRTPATQHATASGQNQPPLFQTPEMATATAGASAQQPPQPGQPQMPQPGPPQPQPQLDPATTGSVPQAGPPQANTAQQAAEVLQNPTAYDPRTVAWAQAQLQQQPAPGSAVEPSPGPVQGGPAPPSSAAGVGPVPSSREASAAPQAALANRLGIAPEVLQGASPHMLRALGHAMMANDPHMVAAITGAMNATTAANAGSGKGYGFTEVNGTLYRTNPMTGQAEPVTSGPPGGLGDVVLQPGDPQRKALNIPDDNRSWKVTTDAKGQRSISPIADPRRDDDKQFQQATQLGQNFESNQSIKAYRAQIDAVTSMGEAFKEGNSAGDLNAMIQVYKAIDPTSVVSVNESNQITNAQGVAPWFLRQMQKATGGGRLNEDERAAYYNAAIGQIRGRSNQANGIINATKNRARTLGLKEEQELSDVVGGLDKIEALKPVSPDAFRNKGSDVINPDPAPGPPAPAPEPGAAGSATNPLVITNETDVRDLMKQPHGSNVHYRYPSDPPGKVRVW